MVDDAREYARLHEILGAARSLGGAELDAYLSSACGEDGALRFRVLELLRAGSDDDSGDVFAEARIAHAREGLETMMESDAPGTWLPEKIGQYEVVQELGRGGMGVVYEARQEFPRRRVAIKLLHPLHATVEGLKRFRHEAQLLGRLEHPGIVRIFEAGTFDVGRGAQPFFAMELVEGSDIRAHCQRQGLDRGQRIALLARVCDAVEYAHERGVIHRDIKPENILVNERGEPRVLDFGIARMNTDSATLSTFVTDEGKLVGTLAYMAPEQLIQSGGATSTSTDVYALGVLSFELLVGRLPHSIEDLSISGAIAVLVSSDPPRVGRLDAALRGDPETVIAKALESEPERRYQRPVDLAADLRRILNHEPIRARPPSRIYRARKFTRRHPALVWGTTATILTLVVGVIVAWALAVREKDQRERATANEQRALESENDAINGLHQSAWVLIDTGSEREAAATLRRIPVEHRGLAWRLLHRAVPFFLEVSPIRWEFVDDQTLVGNSDGGLLVYSLTEERVLRRVFRGLDLEVFERPARCGVLPAGTAEESLLLDFEREIVLERTPRQMTPREENGRIVSLRMRVPQVSDDGRMVLWYTSPSRVEIRVEGKVVRSFSDIQFDESVHLSADGRSVVVNRSTEISLIDLSSGAVRFLQAIEPGKFAMGLPVQGGILLSNRLRFRRILGQPTVWRRLALDDTSGPVLTDPFSEGFVEASVMSTLTYPRDGRFVVLTFDGYAGCILGDPETGACWGSGWLTTEQGLLRFPDSASSSATVSPSGRRIAVSGSSAPTMIVEIDEREKDPTFDQRVSTLRGHRPPPPKPPHDGWVYHLAISNDGSLISSAAPRDPLVRLWDTRSGALIGTLERDCRDPGSWGALMAFRADDTRLCVTTPYGGRLATLVEWDLLSANATAHASLEKEENSHLGLLDAMIETLDARPGARLGKRVQMAGDRAVVAYYPINPHLIDHPVPPEGKRWSYLPGDGQRGMGLSLHPSANQAAVVRDATEQPIARQGRLTIVDTSSGETLVERQLDFQPWCVAYSPDGSVLAIGTHEGRVLLIETRYHTQQLEWKAHDRYVYSLAWTPDGTRLVTASGDTTLRVWDTRNRVVSRLAEDRLEALRARMTSSSRDELLEAVSRSGGEEREAARVELIRRAHGL